MKKPAPKKLRLSTETLANLSVQQLDNVVGGQRDPNPNRTKEESICWCYTSV